ncbi:hypothetical protein Hanom_Chr11g01059811 [Helianthus anomalus]
MQACSCLDIFPASAFCVACPETKPLPLKPARGDTPVRSMQACLPPDHPKTSTSAGRREDLPSFGSVRKLTRASFLDLLSNLQDDITSLPNNLTST